MFAIAGSSGYIGQNFIHFLNEKGETYHLLTRDGSSLDCTGCDTLLYFAGVTSNFALSPQATLEANAGFLLKILEKNQFKKIVYLSSVRLYDFFADGKFHFDHENSRYLFDLSKHYSELTLNKYYANQAYIFRISNIFGGRGTSSGFLQSIFNDVDGGKRSFSFNSSADIKRDYLHVEMLCEAIYYSLNVLQPKAYDLTSGCLLANSDLKTIFEKHGVEIEFRSQEKILNQAEAPRSVELNPIFAQYDVTKAIEKEIERKKHG